MRRRRRGRAPPCERAARAIARSTARTRRGRPAPAGLRHVRAGHREARETAAPRARRSPRRGARRSTRRACSSARSARASGAARRSRARTSRPRRRRRAARSPVSPRPWRRTTRGSFRPGSRYLRDDEDEAAAALRRGRGAANSSDLRPSSGVLVGARSDGVASAERRGAREQLSSPETKKKFARRPIPGHFRVPVGWCGPDP